MHSIAWSERRDDEAGRNSESRSANSWQWPQYSHSQNPARRTAMAEFPPPAQSASHAADRSDRTRPAARSVSRPRVVADFPRPHPDQHRELGHDPQLRLFSDATEIFIFISGYTAAFVYGHAMNERGFVVASARILRRAWQSMSRMSSSSSSIMAEIAYVASSFENPLYAEEMGALDFLKQPDVTMVQALLLKFKPVNMDVLPLYIVLLFLFPPSCGCCCGSRRSRCASVAALCRGARNSAGICPPIRAGPGSSIRSRGNCSSCSAPGARWAAASAVGELVRSRHARRIAIAYLVFAFADRDDLVLPALRRSCPEVLQDWMYPIDKTNLDVLRFAHFLALAVVTVRFVPRTGRVCNRAASVRRSVRPAFAGNLLPRRFPGLCRPFRHGRDFAGGRECRSWSAC